MKLGPFEIKLFKKEESQKTPTTAGAFGQEIGVTGTTVYSGIIYDEYNVDLQHTKKYEEYEKKGELCGKGKPALELPPKAKKTQLQFL